MNTKEKRQSMKTSVVEMEMEMEMKMEEQGGVMRIGKKRATCEECKLNLSKYNCPGCSLRSCSLPCVKAHKLRSGCTGKKRLADFVPLSDFNDNLLISDYNMLEDVRRVTEAARRTRAKVCAYSYPQYRLPFYLKGLRSAAASRRTKLLFLPSGMSKRDKNKSKYDHRKKSIQWTIELRFHSTDVVLLDHGVHEDRNLRSVVESHLQPSPWNNKLKQFTNEQLDSLKFFVRKYPKGTKSPFRELDIESPLRQQLSNLVILEYPVIHIFLPTQSYDFEVVKDVLYKPEPRDCGANDAPIPKGIPFKEEEIEGDNISADPQVFDLMKSSPLPAHHQDGKLQKSLMNSCDNPLVERGAAGTSSRSSLINAEELVDFDDLDFEFDQGLIDAFSDLIAEVNPDDYLDLEGIFTKDDEPAVEEVEEGEIQE